MTPNSARQKGGGLLLGVRPRSGQAGPFGRAVADESDDDAPDDISEPDPPTRGPARRSGQPKRRR